jgi:hypothetical protein
LSSLLNRCLHTRTNCRAGPSGESKPTTCAFEEIIIIVTKVMKARKTAKISKNTLSYIFREYIIIFGVVKITEEGISLAKDIFENIKWVKSTSTCEIKAWSSKATSCIVILSSLTYIA